MILVLISDGYTIFRFFLILYDLVKEMIPFMISCHYRGDDYVCKSLSIFFLEGLVTSLINAIFLNGPRTLDSSLGVGTNALSFRHSREIVVV